MYRTRSLILCVIHYGKTHSVEELHNYEAYCIIVGSTPLAQPERFDLEGDESIEQFIERLESDIEEMEKK